MAETRVIRTFVTHLRPHLDEIVAIWLFLKWRVICKINASRARIVFLLGDGLCSDGRTLAQHRRDPTSVLIGIGGSEFDEHAANGQSRKKGECAATLTMKDLGNEKRPELQGLLRFVLRTDLKGAIHPFDLSQMVRLGYGPPPPNGDIWTPEEGEIHKKVILDTFAHLEDIYDKELRFRKAGEELGSNSSPESIPGPGGRELTLVVVKSDRDMVNKCARKKGGMKADIVVQQRSSGHISIFTAYGRGLSLKGVAGMLHIEEQKAAGKVVTTDWHQLQAEGEVPGDDRWFYYPATETLLNGSSTHPRDATRLKLELEKVVELVKIAVDPSRFEPTRSRDCLAGRCTSTHSAPCPWQEWVLPRCRHLRHIQYQERQGTA